MQKDPFPNAVNDLMEKLQQSPEYHANCRHFSQECARLQNVARDLYVRKEALQAYCEAATVRKEYASGSTLHRGYYCPSPTYDIIVGNTKRGKLLKRLTVVSKPSHEYGFDANGKLLYCKWIRKGKTIYTEYLVYEDDRIFGLTVSCGGDLSYFTEELWSDGKLTDYSNGLFLPKDGEYFCIEISQEHYTYDVQGLSACEMHRFMQTPFIHPGVPETVLARIPQMVYQHIGKFRFQRKNGFLISYTNQQGHAYQVHTKRKA